jgi:cytochrome c biogenesis protein
LSTDARTEITPPAPSRSKILLEFLGSMNLAITLLAATAIAAVIGTVLKQNEPYQNYVIQFGAFWFQVFKSIGLYDVYSTWWFMTILGFLVISTSVCIVRNSPGMVREMRNFRLGVQLKSLQAFNFNKQWNVPADQDATVHAVSTIVRAYGYRVRRKDHGDHVMLAAMKGRINRLGYIFTHTAIVVICLGALADGTASLKLKALTGAIQVETKDLPASQVPKKSWLSVHNPSFRGSVTIPEGTSANLCFLQLWNGYLVQPLPFTIDLKKFRIRHYPSGKPRSFESDVVIHDPSNPGHPIAATIAVNHPLTYKGYTIYQASFSDGGTHETLKAWPLQSSDLDPQVVKSSVFSKVPVNTAKGPLTLELTNFRMYNINRKETGSGKEDFFNLGPSFTYKLRNAEGVATEYNTYMAPVEQDGRLFYLTGMRTSPAQPYRYLHIPADPDGGVKRFMTFNAWIHDPERVKKIAEQTTRETFAEAKMNNEQMEHRIVDTMDRLVSLFAKGGFQAIATQVDKQVPKDRRGKVMDAYMKVLQNVLGTLYVDVLKQEGVDVSKGVSQKDAQFYDDALTAIAALPKYGAPFFLQMTNFKQVQASGFQIARAPGKIVVYMGFGLLIIGVFLMFYVAHRRLWFWVDRGDGGTRVLFAGTGNRNQRDFEQEFETLRDTFERQFNS